MSIQTGELRTLGREGYIYLYPLVVMDISRRQATSARAGERQGFGPANEFHHIRQFPSADFRAVVRPNFDTLYSSAWLDLTAGVVRLDVHDTAGRYFMLPIMDMWTDVFATVGSRTTGTMDQSFTIAWPGHTGELPQDGTLITSPTPYAWIIGRTQTNGPNDYAAVHKVQDGYVLTASAPAPVHVDVVTDTEPPAAVAAMNALEFFALAATLLRVNHPHPTDFSILARLARLGIHADRPFDAAAFDDAEAAAQISAGVDEARDVITEGLRSFGAAVDGWATQTETIGVYGNAYSKRALVACGGLGANPAEDAVYPVLITDADGQAVTGENDYLLHFAPDALPPADAFWSVTMYDADGYQAANELNRFALGDRDPLVYNPDGSLDIHIRHTNPGPELEPNWLPAPLGPLGITMRLYVPRPEVLSGAWAPPPVRKT